MLRCFSLALAAFACDGLATQSNDASFDAGSGSNGQITGVIAQADGEVLVCPGGGGTTGGSGVGGTSGCTVTASDGVREFAMLQFFGLLALCLVASSYRTRCSKAR